VGLDIEGVANRTRVEGLAQDIVEERCDPYTGARSIWEVVADRPLEIRSKADPFVYAASEWEGRPEDREDFERGMVDEARRLLRRSGP